MIWPSSRQSSLKNQKNTSKTLIWTTLWTQRLTETLMMQWAPREAERSSKSSHRNCSQYLGASKFRETKSRSIDSFQRTSINWSNICSMTSSSIISYQNIRNTKKAAASSTTTWQWPRCGTCASMATLAYSSTINWSKMALSLHPIRLHCSNGQATNYGPFTKMKWETLQPCCPNWKLTWRACSQILERRQKTKRRKN